jgi:hypothetical protein
MFKNRFLLVLGIVSLLLVSMAISSFRSKAVSPSNREAASDFYQRHPNWTWSASAPAAPFPDYFQRHPELIAASVNGAGASDYFQRHPKLTALAIPARDTSDYYLRHPESSAVGSSVDLTDYYFRHIND